MKKLLIMMLLTVLLFSGCSGSSSDQGRMAEVAPSEQPAMEAPDYDYASSDEEAGYKDETNDGTMPEQRLIRQGNLRVEVQDAIATGDDIRNYVRSIGGFVSDETQYINMIDGREYYSLDMSVRMPEHRFDEALDFISELGKVDYRYVNVIDVTEQYIDLEARLNNLKAEEERFVAIFDQAETVEDLLAVESELARLRGDIESLEGQFRYLQNRVSLATLSVNLTEERIKTAELESFTFSETFQNMGVSFTRGVYNFFLFLGNLFVGLAYILPFALFLGLIAILAIWILRMARKKRNDQRTQSSREDVLDKTKKDER